MLYYVKHKQNTWQGSAGDSTRRRAAGGNLYSEMVKGRSYHRSLESAQKAANRHEVAVICDLEGKHVGYGKGGAEAYVRAL